MYMVSWVSNVEGFFLEVTVATSMATRVEPAGCCSPTMSAAERTRAKEAAEVFAALGDPIRMQIVQLLAREPALCVCEIQQAFDLVQPTISHHLRLLRKAGLLGSEKRGTWVYYFLRRDAVKQSAGYMLELL